MLVLVQSSRASSTRLPAGAACRTVDAARRHDGYADADLPMVLQSTRSSRVRTERAQICRHGAPVPETLLWMVDAASDAKRLGWLDRLRDYGRRLSWAWLKHANEPLAMFQRSSPLSCPRKWPWKSGNGGFLSFFAFSACRLEMIFSSPVEIKKPAISNVQHVHPLRGTACVGRRRPVLGRRGARLSHGCGKGGG
jgi:hypothetical protein